MRLGERIDAERLELLNEKQHIDQRLEANKDNRTLAAQQAIGRLKLRSQHIQNRLSELKVERKNLHDSNKPPTSKSPQARVAVLYKVAKAADGFLFGDADDEAAGDALEAALEELDNIVPGWRNYEKRVL